MKSTLTRVVFILLVVALVSLGLWIWYMAQPAKEVVTTAPPVNNSSLASTGPDTYQTESMQSLRDGLEALRTQMYRNEAALRYELTSTYQRIAVLEQNQQQSGGEHVLQNVAQRLAEVSRLYASHGLNKGVQLLTDTSNWLKQQPEYAHLAAQLADDAQSVREWNVHYRTLNNELGRIKDALRQLPTMPNLTIDATATPANESEPDILEALQDFAQKSFRIQQHRSPEQPLKNALTLEIYRIHAQLLVREMRFASTQRSSEQLVLLKSQLLDAVQQFPRSPNRDNLEQLITSLIIPNTPTFKPLVVQE